LIAPVADYTVSHHKTARPLTRYSGQPETGIPRVGTQSTITRLFPVRITWGPEGQKMNEVSYFRIRAQHHSQLALEASDPSLTAAHEAIAAEMTAKVATADPNRKVVLVDGAAVDTYWSPAA
jgi:hypothetical protein